MDAVQYSTLMDAVADVPDPRHARGKRHHWRVMLTLITAALVCQQRSGRAIGQWVREHAADLRPLLADPLRPLPSTSTLRRALRTIDVSALEARLAQFSQHLAAPVQGSGPWQAQAVDGKAVRGANRHGAQLHLVSLVQHASGVVQAQVRVAAKSNEITAVPLLLETRDLRGTVTTMDALLTQQDIAQRIVDRHGHYLMIVKENQPRLWAAIDLVFRQPPPPQASDARASVTLREKGHGRLETRTLERTAALTGYLEWPGARQVLRRTCERIIVKTGLLSRETTYGVTSLPPDAVTVTQLEALWRGHWTIENKVHYVRDVTFGEDAGQAYCGHTAQALAALRNGILNVLRSQGVTNMADGLRHYGASVERALTLIGTPHRL